jgi:hypothetical protein
MRKLPQLRPLSPHCGERGQDEGRIPNGPVSIGEIGRAFTLTTGPDAVGHLDTAVSRPAAIDAAPAYGRGQQRVRDGAPASVEDNIAVFPSANTADCAWGSPDLAAHYPGVAFLWEIFSFHFSILK